MRWEPAEVNIEALEWDDENVGHLAQHQVSMEDVEAVLDGSHFLYLNIPGRTATHVMIGRDGKGRALLIALLETQEGVWRPITAYESREVRKAVEAME